jgi:hypothetical protein
VQATPGGHSGGSFAATDSRDGNARHRRYGDADDDDGGQS